ncbi:CBS domain-containing protein [Myroides guanonis]|uniref:CBS domain-containing protein n=2 Tax=Myroides guanonis TaxID=1150112 RepID=A0A1I3MIW8_9FLAO|nr:CBS domain-containing protein [Myroides guanonis]
MFTMKERIPVSIVMTENVVKLNLKDTLSKAEELFLKHNIRHLPVVDGDRIVGILSYTDLLRVGVAEGLDEEDRVISATIYDMYCLEQVMTKDVVTIESHTNVREAAEILVKSGFRALPIMKDENLVGMLTTTDLILYLLKQYD